MARILCVEDDTTNRVLMREILKRGGYEVLEAPDGDMALALLHSESIDLAVIDLRLPGMTGLDLIRIIRQNPDIAPLPVIALSADMYTAEDCFEAGSDAFLSKPLHPQSLIGEVRKLLEK